MKNDSGISRRFVAGFAVAVLCIAVQATAQVTNPVPYFQSFEDYFDLDGSNIVSNLGWEGEEGAVVAVVATYSAPSFPIPGADHTTIAELREPVAIHIDGSEQANGTVWVDYLVKPKRWEEDNPPEDIPEDAQLAVYVDTNGFLNIYHADNGATNSFPEYPGGGTWSVVADPAFMIPDNEWVRLTVNIDYGIQDSSAAYFSIMLNGNMITHANAHYDPQGFDYFREDVEQYSGDDAGEGKGSWFPVATLNASMQLREISLRGSGLFDDFVVSADAPVISNITYHTIMAGVTGNGSIAAVDNDINSAGVVRVLPGASQQFTWEADYGHFYSSVTIGENGATNTHNKPLYASGYTFTNLSADGSVTVNFGALDTFILETSVIGGTINPNGPLTVVIGENRTFTWAPAYGYAFDSVTIVENGGTNTFTTEHTTGYTFTNVIANGSVSVLFEALPTFDIEASADGGSINPSGTVAVPIGYDRSFTWSPSYGNAFSNVTIVKNGVTNTYTDAEYRTGYTFTNVNAAGSIAVSFTALPRYTIEASAVGGTIDPSGSVTNIVQGESREFSWLPTPGYRFLSVTIVENDVEDTFTTGYETGYTFANVIDDGSIVVTFEEIPRSPGLKQWLIDTGLGLGFEMTPAAWKAYIASTDPNNPAFLFEVSRTWKTNGTNFVQWKSIYVDTNLPPFGILATTNMMQPMVVTGLTPRVAGTGSNVVTNTWSETAPTWPVYYRVVATNTPPEEEP